MESGYRTQRIGFLLVALVTLVSVVYGDSDLSARFYRLGSIETAEQINPISSVAVRLLDCGQLCVLYHKHDAGGASCYSFLYEAASSVCNISTQIGFRNSSSGSTVPIMLSLSSGLQYSDNLALGKDTDESSVAYTIDGSKAVDGDIDSLMHTSDQGDDSNPWLKIDMAAAKLVVSVSILNRPVWGSPSNMVNQRFREVGFYVGDQSEPASLAQDSNLCHYQVSAAAPAILTSFDCSLSDTKLYNHSSSVWEYYKLGRYFLIQLNYDDAVLHINEVYIAGYSL